MKKKIMWIVSLIPWVVTAFILPILPETMPMHYDAKGNIDRWGNKIEQLLFPVLIILITGFWYLFVRYYEKKAQKVKTEKESMESLANAKILSIVGISEAVMFGIMHFFILYSAYVEAGMGITKAHISIGKVSCILCGVFFIILGNFMPKSRRNGSVGLRTTWSLYSDNTWRKSNRFGAVCLVVAGILTIITSIFANTMLSTVCLLIYIITASVISVVYSMIIYKKEVQEIV